MHGSKKEKKKRKKKSWCLVFLQQTLGKKVSTYIHTVMTGVYSVNYNKSRNQTRLI